MQIATFPALGPRVDKSGRRIDKKCAPLSGAHDPAKNIKSCDNSQPRPTPRAPQRLSSRAAEQPQHGGRGIVASVDTMAGTIWLIFPVANPFARSTLAAGILLLQFPECFGFRSLEVWRQSPSAAPRHARPPSVAPPPFFFAPFAPCNFPRAPRLLKPASKQRHLFFSIPFSLHTRCTEPTR